MNQTLTKLREKRAKGENGFTLIELLVVVVILGVLIAIAVPLYLNYRKGANDAAAESDIRGAINALEQCNADNGSYPKAVFTIVPPATSAAAGTCTTQKLNLSKDTSVSYKITGTPTFTVGTGYVIVSTNASGSGKVYCYNSTKSGQVAALAAGATLASGTC